MTVEKYRFCRTTPLYRPALDVVARAPDGSIAAFALGWLDPLTLGVELEPVGVVPEHQRRGLGAAVCRAALRAATGMGATRAVIAARPPTGGERPPCLAGAAGGGAGRRLAPPRAGLRTQRRRVARPTVTAIAHRTTNTGMPPGKVRPIVESRLEIVFPMAVIASPKNVEIEAPRVWMYSPMW